MRQALVASDDSRPRTLFAQSGHSFVAENARREVEGLIGYWTSIRRGELKLIHIPTRDGADYELYDVATDPQETVNLLPDMQASAGRLATALDHWRRLLLSNAPRAPETGDRLDPDEVARLRALGYLN